MSGDQKIINNEGNHRFEIQVKDENAYIDYSIQKGKLSLIYIFVPVSSRGKGLSGLLIQYALDFAKERKLDLEVHCFFISRYLATHPQKLEVSS